MTYNTYELEDSALPLPITLAARRKAQEFASGQPTPQKAEQVRLNTLAVYAVKDYLEMMGIPCDLSIADIWNPIARLCADVADLEVTGIGRLECRPLKLHEQTCYIPPEVWLDRIGYVVVQIDESSLSATVLGFTQTANTEEVSINQLRPVEDLIDHLNQPMPIAAAPTPAMAGSQRVNLSQWLANAFETGWQTLESLLNPEQPDLAFSFRSVDSTVLSDSELLDVGIRRAKLIDLGIQVAGHPVALIIELTPETERKRSILLQVHPADNQLYLPPSLQLTVLDESGATFLEAQSRSADNYIQLQFSGVPGEQFSVRVSLGDASILQDFVI
jgi:hypothetical protein